MPGPFGSYEAASNVVPLVNVLSSLQAMTDDECIARLASAMDGRDEARLEELAALISRLAVPIEI